jgi:acyl-CoA reductase-like NAD-dependent aldehyde dehydrogenase
MAGAQTPMFTALLIDGELVAGQGVVEPILNPATGEVLTHIAEASTEQVEAAILAAHRAFAELVADHTAATLEPAAGHRQRH